MAAVTGVSFSDASRADKNSAIDRVRVRMTRLIHPARERPVPPPVVPSRERAEAAQVAPVTVATPQVSPLGADVRTLQEILDDSEQLLRQAWGVAADLNQVRRQCRHCQETVVLAEALGTFQGLLNRCRHNLRTAARAVDNIRAGVLAGR